MYGTQEFLMNVNTDPLLRKKPANNIIVTIHSGTTDIARDMSSVLHDSKYPMSNMHTADNQ